MSSPARWMMLTFVVCCTLTGSAAADVIRLKSGGEIRGEFPAGQHPSADPLIIHTLTGGIVAVEQRDVEFVTRRPRVVEDYETRRKLLPNTVEAHFELADWCRNNSLRAERDTHLEAVLEIDPDHEQAHRLLGHVRHEGAWTTRDEMMTAQGYVKHKGRYILPQELELIEKSNEQFEAERIWFNKINLWHAWLTGTNDSRRLEALRELQKIDDPHAVPALIRNFRDDANEQVRTFYVQLLTKLGGPKSFEALVYQSLRDPSAEARQLALEGIPEEGRAIAIPFFIRALKSDLNHEVTRAGAALRKFGDTQAVPALIDALVTTHRYRVRYVEPTPTVGFTTNGGMGNSGVVLPPEIQAMLLTGQLPNGVIYQDLTPRAQGTIKSVVIKHDHQNAEVLAALQQLTGQDFGYDERTWRLWWASQQNS